VRACIPPTGSCLGTSRLLRRSGGGAAEVYGGKGCLSAIPGDLGSSGLKWSWDWRGMALLSEKGSCERVCWGYWSRLCIDGLYAAYWSSKGDLMPPVGVWESSPGNGGSE
jgi:hypothetical protein